MSLGYADWSPGRFSAFSISIFHKTHAYLSHAQKNVESKNESCWDCGVSVEAVKPRADLNDHLDSVGTSYIIHKVNSPVILHSTLVNLLMILASSCCCCQGRRVMLIIYA